VRLANYATFSGRARRSSLAVGVRRLHDIGRSGWWLLIGLVPLVGGILLIVWYCQDSHGPNSHGPSPKQVSDGYGDPAASTA
jgi:uncharacterized membrane protein YhaH (DUF805 family)